MDQLITSSSISCRADSVCGKYLFMQHDCNLIQGKCAIGFNWQTQIFNLKMDVVKSPIVEIRLNDESTVLLANMETSHSSWRVSYFWVVLIQKISKIGLSLGY